MGEYLLIPITTSILSKDNSAILGRQKIRLNPQQLLGLVKPMLVVRLNITSLFTTTFGMSARPILFEVQVYQTTLFPHGFIILILINKL